MHVFIVGEPKIHSIIQELYAKNMQLSHRSNTLSFDEHKKIFLYENGPVVGSVVVY